MPIIDANDISDLLQRTLNSVDERIVGHGKRVSFIVSRMLEAQGVYTQKEKQEICFLALLHDVGAYKTEEIDQMLRFETENIWEHSIYGYLFLLYLSPLTKFAQAVLFHHLSYDKLRETKTDCKDIAQILHLADRVDIFNEHEPMRKELLKEHLERSSGSRFSPEVLSLFWKADEKYHIWDGLEDDIDFHSMIGEVAFSQKTIRMYLNMIVFTIDFRSHHTVTHTVTTTQIAFRTAQLMGVDQDTLRKIYYGAMLHDLGKVGVPVEILEFPGKLSAQAMRVMRTHVDITEAILADSFDPVITQIALRHHEKLNGSGYQRGLMARDLTIPERIVAVSDIVSALYGTRSYKESFPKEKTLHIIQKQSGEGLIDKTVVAVISDNFDSIMETVKERCEPVWELYHKMQDEYRRLMEQYAGTALSTSAGKTDFA